MPEIREMLDQTSLDGLFNLASHFPDWTGFPCLPGPVSGSLIDDRTPGEKSPEVWTNLVKRSNKNASSIEIFTTVIFIGRYWFTVA